MKPFLLILPLFVVASLARPEAGYAYNRPQTNFILPTNGPGCGPTGSNYRPCGNLGTINIAGSGLGGNFLQSNQAQQNIYQQQQQLQQQLQIQQQQQFQIQQQQQLQIQQQQQQQPPSFISQLTAPAGPGPAPIPTQAFIPAPQAPIIQKHIYVHVPPPEVEESRPQRIIGQNERPVKHYRIIFIKAPSAPAPTPAQILAAQQSQEKTLIYVLAKRPDEAEDVLLPTSAPTSPSKPEVYFIRYKAQKDASQSTAPLPVQPIDNTGDAIITTNPFIPGRTNEGYQYNVPSGGAANLNGGTINISGANAGAISSAGISAPASSYGVPNQIPQIPSTAYGVPGLQGGQYKRKADKRDVKKQ